LIKSTLSIYDLMKKFPNEESARLYFEKQLWNGKPTCPKCNDDTRQYARKSKERAGYYLCRNCGFGYTARTGTIFQSSNLPLFKWFNAFRLVHEDRKGFSSIKLSKELGITQKSAWHMGHRVREMIADRGLNVLKGEVEADEAYFGGKEKNKHAIKKLRLGRGAVGKTAVLDIKERGGRVKSIVLKDTSAKTIQGELNKHIVKDATLYTDEHGAYTNNKFKHKVVNHSAKQYVDGRAHTNSLENHWSLLKRGHYGVYHNLSEKHLQRYADEFDYRANDAKVDRPTMDVIDDLLGKAKGKRLTYNRLIGKQTE